jgi:hypothetical protein
MSSDIEDDDEFVVLSEDDIDEVDDEDDGDMEVQEAAPSGSRSLAVRRAIEQRNEQKMMEHDLNYLECDLEDEE